MKHLVLITALCLVGPLAHADNFSNRAAAGRIASATPEGSKYDISLTPLIRTAGEVCDPPGTTLPVSQLGHFDLVGDITKNGQVINIEVKPDNPLAQCFANQIAQAQLAPPPPSARTLYPILIDLTVTN